MRIKSIRVARVIGVHAHFMIPAEKYGLKFDCELFRCPGVIVDFPNSQRFVPMSNIDEIEFANEPIKATVRSPGEGGSSETDRKNSRTRVSSPA